MVTVSIRHLLILVTALASLTPPGASPASAQVAAEPDVPDTGYGLSRLMPISSAGGSTVTMTIQQIAIGAADPVPAADLYGDGLVRFALDDQTAAALPVPTGTFTVPMATANHIVSNISTAGIATATALSSDGQGTTLEVAGDQKASSFAQNPGRKPRSVLKGKALKNRMKQSLALLNAAATAKQAASAAVKLVPVPASTIKPAK